MSRRPSSAASAVRVSPPMTAAAAVRSMRQLIALLLMPVLLVTLAGPSAAHASKLDATPAAGSTVATAPTEVVVRFDSPILDTGAALVVTNADGEVVSAPEPTIGRTSISAAVDPAAPAGVYTVAFRVVSADGHTVSEEFEYTVAGAAQVQSPSPAASVPASSAEAAPVESAPVDAAQADAVPVESAPAAEASVPGVVWLIAVLGLVAIVVALALRRRGR